MGRTGAHRRRQEMDRELLSRPIINTRDEPHADAQKYRRLHVIAGDANLSETATFLKVGTTAFVLCLVEDQGLPRTFAFRNPVAAMRQVSHDLTLRQPLELHDGSTVTALEVLPDHSPCAIADQRRQRLRVGAVPDWQGNSRP